MAGERRTVNFGPVTLDRDTAVPVGVAFVFASFLFAGWNYLEDRFSSLHKQFEVMDRRLERMELDEKRVAQDRWTYTDQRLWVSEFKRANPDMNIPDPEK